MVKRLFPLFCVTCFAYLSGATQGASLSTIEPIAPPVPPTAVLIPHHAPPPYRNPPRYERPQQQWSTRPNRASQKSLDLDPGRVLWKKLKEQRLYTRTIQSLEVQTCGESTQVLITLSDKTAWKYFPQFSDTFTLDDLNHVLKPETKAILFCMKNTPGFILELDKTTLLQVQMGTAIEENLPKLAKIQLEVIPAGWLSKTSLTCELTLTDGSCFRFTSPQLALEQSIAAWSVGDPILVSRTHDSKYLLINPNKWVRHEKELLPTDARCLSHHIGVVKLLSSPLLNSED